MARVRAKAGIEVRAEVGVKPKEAPGGKLSSLGAEMIAGLDALIATIEAGEPIEGRFTVRTLKLDLRTAPMVAADVQRVREAMGASQAVLALFLGVSPGTVRGWEQGARPVPMIASRFLEEIEADPSIWRRRIESSVAGPGRATS